MSTGTTATFWTVRGDAASGTVFAAADNGYVYILKPGASTWAPLPLECCNRPGIYFSLWPESSGGFLAGAIEGYMTRFRATPVDSTWTRLAASPHLNGVSVFSPTSAFAVGDFGAAYRLNGSTWSGSAGAVSGFLSDVVATGASTAIAVGNGGAFRFDGSSWLPMNFAAGSSVSLRSVWAASANDAHTATTGAMYRWTGTAWTQVAVPIPTTSTIWSIWGASSNDVWGAGTAGALVRWDGTSWRAVSSGSTATLYKIWGIDANTVYAGGSSGVLLRFNGQNWTPMSFPSTSTITGIWGASANDLYVATGDATFWHWDGTSFAFMTQYSMPNGNALSLLGMAGDRGTFAIAVGTNGLAVRGGAGVSAFGALRALAVRAVSALRGRPAALRGTGADTDSLPAVMPDGARGTPLKPRR
jgi:hypothetical protein